MTTLPRIGLMLGDMTGIGPEIKEGLRADRREPLRCASARRFPLEGSAGFFVDGYDAINVRSRRSAVNLIWMHCDGDRTSHSACAATVRGGRSMP